MTITRRVMMAGVVGLAGVALLLAKVMAALAPLRATITQLAHYMQLFMAANWLAFGLVQTGIAASGVLPAAAIAVMAGATYGFGGGLLISVVSTMVGGWLAFAVCRTALRAPIERWIGRYPLVARLDAAITTESWRFVLLLRISPVMPFALTSYGLGLTRISQRDFLLGTLASLPALVGYVALGALGKQGVAMTTTSASPLHWLALAVGVAAVAYALMRVRSVLAKLSYS